MKNDELKHLRQDEVKWPQQQKYETTYLISNVLPVSLCSACLRVQWLQGWSLTCFSTVCVPYFEGRKLCMDSFTALGIPVLWTQSFLCQRPDRQLASAADWQPINQSSATHFSFSLTRRLNLLKVVSGLFTPADSFSCINQTLVICISL